MKNFILLVDHSSSDAALIQEALNHRTVIIARTSQEALEVLFPSSDADPRCTTMPILIILALPLAIDTLDILGRVRTSAISKNVPILVCSGEETNDDDIINIYSAGANGYVLRDGAFSDTIKTSLDYWLRLNMAPPVRRDL